LPAFAGPAAGWTASRMWPRAGLFAREGRDPGGGKPGGGPSPSGSRLRNARFGKRGFRTVPSPPSSSGVIGSGQDAAAGSPGPGPAAGSPGSGPELELSVSCPVLSNSGCPPLRAWPLPMTCGASAKCRSAAQGGYRFRSGLPPLTFRFRSGDSADSQTLRVSDSRPVSHSFLIRIIMVG
jgi:hypothetical protein